MNAQTYKFRYTILQVEVKIRDGALLTRMGIKEIHIPLDAIEHVYLDNRKERDSNELIISYKGRRGRLRRARLFADHGEEGLYTLYNDLLDARPSAAIVTLNPDEAYLVLGSKPSDWAAIPLVMLAAFAFVALACTPLFIHGLDDGLVEIHIDSLTRVPNLSSRNILVDGGRVAVDHSVQEKPAEGEDPDLVTVWAPLVSPAWTAEVSVDVLVQFRLRDLDAVLAKKQLDGVVRDVWWEGVTARVRRELKEKGIALTDRVMLIEAQVHGSDDLKLAYLILGVLAVPMLGVALTLRSRARMRALRHRA